MAAVGAAGVCVVTELAGCGIHQAIRTAGSTGLQGIDPFVGVVLPYIFGLPGAQGLAVGGQSGGADPGHVAAAGQLDFIIVPALHQPAF